MSSFDEIKYLIRNVSDKGFFNLLSANILIQIVAFASQLIVAGILSPDDLGRIKVLQIWLSIFTIIGNMGLSSSVLKLCSENRTKSDVQQIFKSSISFSLITTLSAYLIVLIINWLGWLSTDTLIRSLVPIALLPLVSSTFFSVYIAYYQSRKEIKFISNLTSINKVFSVALILIFTFFWGIKGYFIGYNIAIIILVIIIIAITKLPLARNQSLVPSTNHLHLHWKYARPSFFANLLADLTAYADILLINFLIKDLQEIGFYSFALTLTVMFRVLPATVQQITIPYFSGLDGNRVEFHRIYRRYSRFLILIITGTLIVALIAVPPFIHLIFKGKFTTSMSIYFIPLAIGWSIRQYNQIQAAALFGMGKISEIAKIQLIALPLIVAAVFISIHFWGLPGAAYSSIFCSIIQVVLGIYYYKKSIFQKE